MSNPIQLRWYQSEVKAGIYAAWAALGPRGNALAVLPTGAGKTVLFAAVVAEHQGSSCCIAHRQELVSQISMALARNGVRHRIIAPMPVIKAICNQHLEELGAHFYDPNARAAVAGVDTLVRRGEKEYAHWVQQVTLWVQDEAHHVLTGNKWGKAVALFRNAKGLGVTAIPGRADGKGLGRHADGLFDEMVVGPTMRHLIDEGYLTDYRIICAPTHIEWARANVGTDGDYVLDRGVGKQVVRESTIIGDVVKEYQRWAAGKLGVCFTSDLETAADIAAQFRKAGVPAEMVAGTTPDDTRRAILRKFRRREVLVLVNVDLFGEGFDLPAIEVVLMARRTLSFGLYGQQFGRALRLMLDSSGWDALSPAQRLQRIAASPKPRALIIDHVGNVVQHGLPDHRSDWTLDARDKRSKGASDAVPMTNCLNPECLAPYERAKPCCPWCGTKPEPGPGGRSSPEAVDGDLMELDAATLAALRGGAARVAMTNEAYRDELTRQGLPGAWVMRNVKHHDEHRRIALDLADAMAWWAGEHRAAGQSDSEIYRRFYLTFGLDWLSAQAASKGDMLALIARVDAKLTPASFGARVRHAG